jgi:hypothetical protein
MEGDMSKLSRSDLSGIHANSLLATVFSNPSEVLKNPFLTVDAKRCVLAAWASDAFAVEGQPWLRNIPGLLEPIPLRDILHALQSLDDEPPPKGGAAAVSRKSCAARRPPPLLKMAFEPNEMKNACELSGSQAFMLVGEEGLEPSKPYGG